MNIFVLDKDPIKAAQYMCDKHISKMIIESAQLLCTAFDDGVAPYKRTHYNHPCAKWVRESKNNFNWLFYHAWGLNMEYQDRYKGGNTKIDHKSFLVCIWCLENMTKIKFDKIDQTDFVLCMPDQYKVGDAVESYRAYYRLGKPFAKWDKLGNRPEWMDI